MNDPRYPIGKLQQLGPLSTAARRTAIARIAALPAQLHDAVRGLDGERLDTPYRRGGWSLRQVVHHVADSHTNAYVRMKLTVSEREPVLQSYDENAWANAADAALPIGDSLLLVQALHARLAAFLASLPEAAFARRARHSDDGPRTLDDLVAIYGWHGAHHVAHITSLRAAKGW